MPGVPDDATSGDGSGEASDEAFGDDTDDAGEVGAPDTAELDAAADPAG